MQDGGIEQSRYVRGYGVCIKGIDGVEIREVEYNHTFKYGLELIGGDVFDGGVVDIGRTYGSSLHVRLGYDEHPFSIVSEVDQHFGDGRMKDD